jgi:glycosyltransferase involved in cell wall biosynthesis
MAKRISVIIPIYNGSSTIGRCLEAVFASCFGSYEVVVVDDCSDDDSAEIIGNFPCRLVRLGKRSGAARARNEGARQSSGEILFFIDADCLIGENTLLLVDRTITGNEHIVFGGTYTPLPFDRDFFSIFQSIFINYSETKKNRPDYIASHAMVIERKLFLKHGGFPEVFLPIIEDVEFSHRLRKSGTTLLMNPEIMVTHIFNFTLWKSLRNAFKKSFYWTIYSIRNKDLTGDTGTASLELKLNVFSWSLTALLAVLYMISRSSFCIIPVPLITTANLIMNWGLIRALYRVKSIPFTASAVLYYTLIYPVAIAAGGLSGAAVYITSYRSKRNL